jgi:hypothetical protein
VGLNSLKSLNLTNGFPNKNMSNNNKVKSKPLELRSRAKKNCFREWGRKKSRVGKATCGFCYRS